MLRSGRQAQRKEHKETRRGPQSAWQKQPLVSTLLSYLCRDTGEKGKEERAESPDQTPSLAATLDKSIPKIAAPEISTPAQPEGTFHLDGI